MSCRQPGPRPAGGRGRRAPRFLREGDVVEVAIEGLGTFQSGSSTDSRSARHISSYPSSAPVIVTCALTGGIHGKEANASLPEQPDEIVEQGDAAWQAGASILHVHARNPDGSNTMDPSLYRRGELLTDNAQLVHRTVRIAAELDRRPASPEEARAWLGLRGREPGRLPEVRGPLPSGVPAWGAPPGPPGP